VAILTGRWPRWSERFVERDARALAARGHGALVWPVEEALSRARWHPAGGGPPLPPVPLPGAPAFRAGAAARALASCGWRALRWWPAAARAAALLPWKPDIVLAHFAGPPAVAGLALARALGCPLAVFAHARDVWVPWRPGLRAAGAAEGVLVCNRAAEGELLRLLPGLAGRVALCRHGVGAGPGEDAEPAGPEGGRPPECVPPDGPPLALAAARLVPKKGFDVLLEALALLVREGVRFRAELRGEGPCAPALRRQASRLGLDAVLRQGPPLPAAAFGRRLREAAVYAHPSRVAPDGDRDGVPNAILEAMLAGCPVVACGAGGVGEIVEDGATGWLVPPDSPPALARALAEALASPSLRRTRAGEARRRVAGRHGPAEAVRRLEEVLAALAGR